MGRLSRPLGSGGATWPPGDQLLPHISGHSELMVAFSGGSSLVVEMKYDSEIAARGVYSSESQEIRPYYWEAVPVEFTGVCAANQRMRCRPSAPELMQTQAKKDIQSSD